jgi:hypothetical protein
MKYTTLQIASRVLACHDVDPPRKHGAKGNAQDSPVSFPDAETAVEARRGERSR